ncbi:T6SS phospholipase effector Tle1-like catalytic domain-containing protein [Arcobacter sp.]|uniref:T6SS phospholipase effector Tle1-like catalytic domain-containing protein n=1 Tax=unclassified Arcobacter TaxID=2593671 RepID=UPI003AFFBFF0
MSNDITKGNAFHKAGEVVHLNEYCTKENEAIEEDIKTRIAYMVISNKDIEELLNSNDDKQIILDKVVEEYKPYLIKAVKKESIKNNKPLIFDDLSGVNEEIIDKKLVKLCTTQLYNSKSYGSVLKAKKYHHAYKKVLNKDFKINDEKKSTSALTFTKDSCNEIIKKEVNNTSKKLAEDEQAYIVLSMPYVYNIKDGYKTKELELISYEDKIIASFMPELIVEYGIFFDGTMNNIYNVDFYTNFVAFLKEPAKDIEDGLNELSSRRKTKTLKENEQETIQYHIRSTDNPEFTDKTKKMIIKQMNNASKELRYFDSKLVLKLDHDEIITTKKAEKDSKKVFDYLLDVKNKKKDAQEKTISEYIIKEILPDDDEDSSFTNGETNVSRLYRLYDGDDVKKNVDNLPNTRFKLYESGSGTFNPFLQKDYEDDSVIGLGLGMGVSGVIGHCIFACVKIAEQLRSSSISHIDELVLDVFGFSRGSTSARHFICSILNNAELIKCVKRDYTVKMKDNKDIFSALYGDKGYISISDKVFFNPLRTDIKYIHRNKRRVENPYYNMKRIIIDSLSFRFVGIYDTVTHYGLKQSNDFEDLNINFFKNENNTKVGHIVHLMADDEFRYNFEAYSIFTSINKHYYKDSTEKRKDGGAKFEEFYLPGAHADVGGGYNEKAETIYLGKFFVENRKLPKELENKIIKWNEKYNWIETSTIKEIKSKDELENVKEEGFYYCIKKEYSLEAKEDIFGNRTNWLDYLYLYMYKPKVSNKYEHVTMKIMYDKAIYVDSKTQEKKKDEFEMVPLGSFKPYMFNKENDTLTKEDVDTLTNAYKCLKKHEVLKTSNKEAYKKLKDKYIHHSAQKGNFVNDASYKDNDKTDFYGKRVIYNAIGKEFIRS